jgi:hypothetical protein
LPRSTCTITQDWMVLKVERGKPPFPTCKFLLLELLSLIILAALPLPGFDRAFLM